MTKQRRTLKDFFLNCFQSKKSAKSPKPKTLRLEALEDRSLLNVGPVGFDDSLSQQFSYSQMIVTQPEDHHTLTVELPNDVSLTPMEANALNKPNITRLVPSGPNMIRVELTYRENAGSYRLQYSTDGGSTWSSSIVINQTSGGTPIYRLQGLQADTTYWFRARSIIKTGDTAHTNSDWTSPVSAKTDPKLSPGTINISVSERTSSSFKIAWNALSDIAYYRVKIATSEAALENVTPVLVSGATSYTFSNLSPSTQYWVQVRAFPNNGDTYTFATSIRTANTISVLSKPSNVQATADSIGKSATISFKDGSITGLETGSITYEVQYMPSTQTLWSEGTHITKTFSSAGEHSFQISGLTAAETYQVRIRAQSPNSNYENSGWVYVNTPVIKMKAPTITVQTDKTTKNSVTLNISECTQATHYKVFYIAENDYNNGSDNWSTAIFTPANRTSAVVDGLEPGTKYIFRVRAHNADVAAAESAPSEWAYATTKGGVIQFTDMTYTQPSIGTVNLSWGHTDSDEVAGVLVSSRCEGHLDWEWQEKQLLNGDVSGCSFSDLVSGEWHFKVQLVNSNGSILATRTVTVNVDSPCSETEVAKLRAFFNQYTYEQMDDGSAIQLALQNDQDPAWWTGITWTAGTDNRMHVRQIDWEGMTLVGSLDCSGMTYLENVNLNDLWTYDDDAGNEDGITSLNFSGCSSLKAIICGDSLVSSVNLQGCSALEQLILYNQELTSIDVSSCPNLEYLNLMTNYLSEIDLSQNTKLKTLLLNDNNFQWIDLSHNTNLTGLSVCGNDLSALDVSKLTKLEQLYTWDSGLEILDLLKNTKLKKLGCMDDTLQYVWYPGPAKREGDLNLEFYGGEFFYDDEFPDVPDDSIGVNAGDGRDHKWKMIPKDTSAPVETFVVPVSVYNSDDGDTFEWTVPRRNFTLKSTDEEETCCVRFSVTKTIEDYDPAAVAAMLNYFAQTDENGVTNEEKIADLNFRADDPSNWTGLTWTLDGDDEDAPYQLSKVSLVNMDLEGDLDLQECQNLEYVNCETNGSVITNAPVQNDSPLVYALTAKQSDSNDGNAPVQVNAWDGTVFLELWSEFLTHNQISISWNVNDGWLAEDSITPADGVELSGYVIVEDGIATLTLNLDANSMYTADADNTLLGKIAFNLTSNVSANGLRSIPITINSGNESIVTLTADVKGIVYDMNSDKQIDFQDFAEFVKHIGSENSAADFNSDNIVNDDDIALFARNYGLSQDSETPVYFDENYNPVLENAETPDTNAADVPIALMASAVDELQILDEPAALETSGQKWIVKNLEDDFIYQNGKYYYVDNSFRWALYHAENGDTIEFDKSLSGKTYKCTNEIAELEIKKAVTIVGNGVIIDGQTLRRCMTIQVNGTANVTIRNITFQNGFGGAGQGGAIIASSNVILDHCNFYDNFSKYGGAIYGSNIQISDCKFERNESTSIGSGGAISCTKLTADTCQFRENHNQMDGTGCGGAVYCSEAYLTSCTFYHNYTNQFGGALLCKTKAIIDDCTFDSNEAGKHGGAIQLTCSSPGNLIKNCTFVNNVCASAYSNPSQGGAIYNIAGGLTIRDTRFIGNKAGNQFSNGSIVGHGGAIYSVAYYSLEHVLMINNKASEGGGLYLSQGGVELKNCTLTQNHATNNGGGICCTQSGNIPSFIISNSIISGNTCGKSGANIYPMLQSRFIGITVSNSIITGLDPKYTTNDTSNLITKNALLNEEGYPMKVFYNDGTTVNEISPAIKNGAVVMGYYDIYVTKTSNVPKPTDGNGGDDGGGNGGGNGGDDGGSNGGGEEELQKTTITSFNVTANGRKINVQSSGENYKVVVVNKSTGKQAYTSNDHNTSYTVPSKLVNKTFKVQLVSTITNQIVDEKEICVLRAPGVTVKRINQRRIQFTVKKIYPDATGLQITYGGVKINFDQLPGSGNTEEIPVTIGGKKYTFVLRMKAGNAIVTLRCGKNALPSKKISFQQVFTNGAISSISNKASTTIK